MKNRHGHLINNKVKIKGALKNKRGFTLIELIISLALVSLVLVATYSFLGSTNKLFTVNAKRSDAQSQLRLVMDGLKKEVGTSSSVKISSNSSVTPGSTERMFYSGTTSGTSYTLLLKTTGGTTLAFGDMQLKSFSITFSTSVTAPRMLTVTMSTSEGYSLTGTILAPNVSSIGGVLTGNTLTCVSALPVIPTYNDLINFEKNMFNIIGTNAVFSIGENNTFNPQSNSSILMQGTSLTLAGLGNNLNGNIAIKADTLNLGSGQTGTSNGESIFDVNAFTGSLSSYNSTFYVHDAFVDSSKNYNKIENYGGTFWSYLFANKGDSRTIDMTVRTLKNNIDFTDKSINPTIDISKIHYITGTSPNIITDNKLPDYKGVMSSVANVNSGSYEYIICHGPLTINTTDPNNGKFNFTGIIYCDDVVTFNDMGSDTFSGIIISKGLKALNVIGNQTHNWNVFYNNNSNNLSEFNGIINNITTSSP